MAHRGGCAAQGKISRQVNSDWPAWVAFTTMHKALPRGTTVGPSPFYRQYRQLLECVDRWKDLSSALVEATEGIRAR